MPSQGHATNTTEVFSVLNKHFTVWYFHLCVLKNELLLIAVNVDPNCCPDSIRPTQSVDYSGTIGEDNP